MKYNKYKILIGIASIVLCLFVVVTFLPITEGYDVYKDKPKAFTKPYQNADTGIQRAYSDLTNMRKSINDLAKKIRSLNEEIKSKKFKTKSPAYRDATVKDRDKTQKDIDFKVTQYNAGIQLYTNMLVRSQNAMNSSGSGPGAPGSIENAAPHYPLYKFKGCWTYGHDVAYPVVNRLVFGNVKTMNECVGKSSNLGMPTAAYDGKNICMGGMFDYKSKTSAKCVDTYPNGKSWLVYSKSAI